MFRHYLRMTVVGNNWRAASMKPVYALRYE